MVPDAIGRWKRWPLNENKEPRRAPGAIQPEVVVHYRDGSMPEGRSLRDINQYGACTYTTERRYLGTIVRLILQGCQTTIREDGGTIPKDSTAVNAAQPVRTPSCNAVPRPRGQALVEFVLIVPLVFLLAVNAVNFAGFIFAWITVANAARAGAQYMVLSSASPGAPAPATLAQIKALVTSDVASLKNKSSVTVAICTNSTTSSNGCTTLTDPEAPSYTLATVDVTYTYNPYIPLFSFPDLSISATLPSSTVHRKAVMRMLQ